jgi:hypothetical protein
MNCWESVRASIHGIWNINKSSNVNVFFYIIFAFKSIISTFILPGTMSIGTLKGAEKIHRFFV